MKNFYRLGILTVFILCFVSGAYAETITRVIPVKYRSAEELSRVLSSLTGEKAKVAAYEQNLLIVAPEEDVNALEDIVSKLDQERQVLRIFVKQRVRKAQVGESSEENENSQSRFEYRLGNLTKAKEQSLLLTEGEKGLLTVGKEVPFTRHMALLSGKHSGISKTIEFKKVSTGFWVRPFVQDDQAVLQIEPYMASWRNEKEALNFQALSTNVVVPLGEWFKLSEHLESANEVNRSILVWKAGQGSQVRDVWVKVKKLSFDLGEED